MTTQIAHASALRLLRMENDRLKRDLDLTRNESEIRKSFVRGLRALQVARSSARTVVDLLTFLETALTTAVAGSHANDGALLMVDSDTSELVFVVVRGSVSTTLPGYRFRQGEGVAGWVFEHGTPLVVSEPYADPRFSPRVDAPFQVTKRNLAAVPIRGAEGTLGVLEVLNRQDDRPFDRNDVEVLSVLADLVAGAITRVDLATRARAL